MVDSRPPALNIQVASAATGHHACPAACAVVDGAYLGEGGEAADAADSRLCRAENYYSNMLLIEPHVLDSVAVGRQGSSPIMPQIPAQEMHIG